MLNLLKHLKPFVGSMILAVALLFVQAICDLSLPDYMSDIVNVGIQQGGVENAVPKVIKSSEMKKLFIFMDDNQKTVVDDNYILLDKDNLTTDEYNKYLKDYPELENESIYKLNTKEKEKLDKLNNIFGKPMLIVSMLESKGLSGVPGIDGMATQGMDLSTMDPFEVLNMMPQDQIDSMLSNVDEKLADMPESMITQSATSYVKEQYKDIGINTDKLQSNYVIVAGVKMVGIALISMVATVFVSFIAARVGAALGRNLRKDVFNKVVGFSNTEFDEFSTASLITRTTNDIQQIIMLVVMGLRIVFYRLNLVTRESLTGMLVIRAFSTQKYEEDKFEVANKNLTKTNLFVNRIMTTMMPLMMFIMNAITLLIVWVGAHRIDEGIMQVGTMMAFMQYTMQIIMAFLMISMVSVILPRAMVSAQRVSEVLNVDVVVKDSDNLQTFNHDEKGTIEFKNVSFRYPGADEDVISNVSFKALPGETTAFIGSTGSGKSTLINLIPRFYDATEGEILIDGVNIKNVSQYDLREKIGFIPQKGLLFSGTIESNLKYGGDHISDEDMIKASEIAQAMEFINSKEEKFNTEIAQGGTNVSGGQKQRLAIARAIAKKPEVFIFDDSFSALDFKTDAKLRKAINTELRESTLLIVAQRISTIMNANQIIVLDEGKVVGKGTHKELMKNCEVYQQIALSQLSKEELSNE